MFLNVYCQSVEDEHKPRGPEGPFQFTDRSVPVLVVKDHKGETLKQQLGWFNEAHPERLAEILKKVHRDASPIKPPEGEGGVKFAPRPEEWVNKEGKSMKATFEGLSDDGKTVRFKKEGRLFEVPLDTLSDVSRARIEELTAGEEEDDG